MRWSEFLQTIPPGKVTVVSGALKGLPKPTMPSANVAYRPKWWILTPDVRGYCTSEHCEGEMFFESKTKQESETVASWCTTLDYTCRNCRKTTKHFAVRIISGDENTCSVMKIGEYPSFGPPTPRSLLSKLGEHSDSFLKGRQCENQGLGIGAFAYYRRVVENQKDRLIGEIVKVAEREGASSEMLAGLRAAQKETRFTSAIAKIRGGIPRSLFIKEHNPLTLLHDALSQGLHAEDDDECLRLADAIRRILIQLSERLSEHLREDEKLAAAVGLLLKKE